MKSRNGNILVMMVPFVVAFWGMSLLVFDVGQWVSTEQRQQVVADATLLSSLRVRVEGLQTVAERWREIETSMLEGASNGEVLVPASQWSLVQTRAEALRRALSGYRGRVRAVMGVVFEANGLRNSQAELIVNDATDLGVSAESVTLRDEAHHTRRLAGGWYRREWSRTERAPQPRETSLYFMTTRVPLLGAAWAERGPGSWPNQVSSRGQLRWDVDTENPTVQMHGNGGFPGQWSQVLDGSRVFANRYPVFSARLGRERSDP